MTKEEINKRLDQCLTNIKEQDIVSNFPQLLKDLDYILNKYPEDENSLPLVEQFNYGVEFYEKVMDFYLEFVKKYMKSCYGKEIEFVKDNQIALAGCAGYDAKEDIIHVDSFGFLLGGNEKTSMLQTILHESRHKLQNDAYHEKEIDSFLQYPENMILLLKENIFERDHQEDNRKFYRENYNDMYYEIDADLYGNWAVRNIIQELFKQYVKFAKEHQIKIPQELEPLLLKIQNDITTDSYKAEEKQREFRNRSVQVQREAVGLEKISTVLQVNGEEEDRLIAYDKHIKSHPELVMEYPILKLIMDGDKPKPYEQIIRERRELLDTYKDKRIISNAIPNDTTYEERIIRIYDCIILSDPILTIESLIADNEQEELQSFLLKHPTLVDNYLEELKEIAERTNNNIINQLVEQNKK